MSVLCNCDVLAEEILHDCEQNVIYKGLYLDTCELLILNYNLNKIINWKI